MFDYMYVEDLGYIACALMEKERLAFHDYNVCSGKRISLLKIAEIIKEQMNNPYPEKNTFGLIVFFGTDDFCGT